MSARLASPSGALAPRLRQSPSRPSRVTHRAPRVARASPWSYPDGSNPLEGFFASSSPIDGLGALTGYWYLDVFAGMNVVLLCALALTMDDETFDRRDGD